MTSGTIEIVRPGPLTTVQDDGRPGLARLGVSPSGACDRPAYQLANRLVGNAPNTAALEVTLGGLVARFSRSCWVAVTGAPAPVVSAGRACAPYGPVFVPAGGVLKIGIPAAGLRSYLAVRGGIAVPPVLGSRSTDTLTGIGPAPLRAGQILPIGDATDGPVAPVDLAPVAPLPQEPVIDFQPLCRPGWFADNALDALRDSYRVSPDTNRIGMRLQGNVIERVRQDELPSEGLVAGAIQIPPSGQPVIFLADHPVTGGYPVLGVVRARSLPLLAQARPGQRLRLRVT
ncbi:biotin-dependent carboxylase uncharacterized domain-containing protein [Micromonospora viridifaciens]|uniref:Biotin-dependent carboxylase uncharacterized domain-containing protein n=1 Tax=Micromonospora viridifaciens TaxID=1881 RepID=A0A1C4ZNJ3_MICVI|nr:biotin-dependent carboxyltransferase family protein [Micromonospora viridifaciens]SCF34518.1 biotin-dependent carboxylase uncharacterized domain-containing protein [Micromonospora viridifaciens]